MKKTDRSRSDMRRRILTSQVLACLAPGQGRRSSLGYLPHTIAAFALAVVAALTLTEAPARAAFPGVNGRIACPGVRGSLPTDIDLEIFSVNPDGTGETVLTNNALRDGDVAFSADGLRVAFESQRDLTTPNVSQVYVANNDGDLEGPDVQQLTIGPRGARAPSFSPDGTQIVFHSGRQVSSFEPGDTGPVPVNDVAEIYKMSSTVPETVTPATRLTFTRGQDAVPSWSPDGTKIAWQRLPGNGNPSFDSTRTQNLEVWTMNPDGSGQTNVSNNPGTANNPATPANENSNGLDRDVTWSPNSTQLAFSSTRDNVTPGNQNFEVYKMNRDGTGQTRLTSNTSGDTPDTDGDYDAAKAWSPDGTRILFTTGRTSTVDDSFFFATTMSATAGEAAGLQRVAATTQFDRCDWAKGPAAPPPGGGAGGGTGSGGGGTPGGGTPGGGTPGGGTPGGGTPADTSAPGVPTFSVTDATFAVAGGSTPTIGFSSAKKHKKGTTFRYTLTEVATVKIAISQRLAGRRKGKRCVAPTRKLRKAKKCTRLATRGTLTRTSHQGANSVAFSGRIGSRKLSPGSYQATLTATDAAKNTSRGKTITFTIAKR